MAPPATSSGDGDVPKIVKTLEFALRALSASSATPEELAEIRRLLDGMRASPALRAVEPVTPPRSHLPPLSAREPPLPRIATYSQGMHGFGHIRRNATIAHALRDAGTQAVILMIAEAWQAGAIPMPEGVDCVTLPGLRKEADGGLNARFLDVSDQELITLRSKVIRKALKTFQPDVFLVDYLPLGAGRELVRTLEHIRKRGRTRCVLGLREVLQDPDTTGLVVTGPYMQAAQRQRLLQRARRHPRCDVLEFVPDLVPLIDRADRIIGMGGYNTICEVLSFEKRALIVPRVHPEPEQWIRAQRLRDRGPATQSARPRRGRRDAALRSGRDPAGAARESIARARGALVERSAHASRTTAPRRWCCTRPWR